MPPKPFTAAKIASALAALPGWKYQRRALAKAYVFGDFRQALAFMVQVGFAADRLDHHPEWTNVYNRVAVRLNTHSVGGRVTSLDAQLAGAIEKIALSMGAAGQ